MDEEIKSSAPIPVGPKMGAPNFEQRRPEGDSHSRLVCRDCGFIQYENPKIVVGAVCHWQAKLLLCRSANREVCPTPRERAA